MDIWTAAFLGLVQGLTEFLPVSSSGHLVIAGQLLPYLASPGALFEVFLHLGTLGAVVIFFWKRLLKMDLKYISYLVVGTIPAGLIGFVFQDQIENLFSTPRLVGFFLIFTGFLNYLTNNLNVENEKELSTKSSFLIGLAQSVAILPGVSRSGSTIFAGSKLGLTKEKAAEFSLLLSVPAIVGANLLEFIKYKDSLDFGSTYLIGFIVAFVSGYFAIGVLMRLLQDRKFGVFAYYCFVVGILAIFIF